MLLKRITARLLDTLFNVVILGIISLFFPLFRDLTNSNFGGAWFWYWFMMTITGMGFMVQHLIYQPLLDFFGGTIGKRICQLKLVSHTHSKSKPQLLQILIRSWPYVLPSCILVFFNSEALNIAGMIWFAASNIVGNVSLVWDKAGRTLFDKLSNTSVK